MSEVQGDLLTEPVDSRDPRAGVDVANRLVRDWAVTRMALAEIERMAHPDVIDQHGRVWSWKCEISGTGRARGRYVHDGCMSQPDADSVQRAGFPRYDLLGTNPNYAGLCEVCRKDWPDGHLWPPVLCQGCWRVNTCVCEEAS